MGNSVIHIVPEYPPKIGGISSYAYKIVAEFNRSGIRNVVLVFNANPLKMVGNNIHSVQRNSEEFIENVKKNAEGIAEPVLLLHYVGYGYHKKGYPMWLLKGLKGFKNEFPDSRIITIFHELYAISPPWKSAFWSCLVQRKISKEILDLSSVAIASTIIYKEKLGRWNKSKNIYWLPIFSGVGEGIGYDQNSDRDRNLIVFGGTGIKAHIYRDPVLLNKICKQYGIAKIIDIGPAVTIPIHKINSIVEVKGILSEERISALMSRSLMGLINYSNMPLEKSSIFAAYASHGVIPLVVNAIINKGTNLQPGENMLLYNISDLPVDENRLKTISHNAYLWYQSHSSIKRLINNLIKIVFPDEK